jgi:hypothetical protein
MANPNLFFENVFDRVGATVTVDGGGEAAGYEIEKAFDWRPNTVDRWRANVTNEDIIITVDLGEGTTIACDAVAIGGHNLGTLGASIQVRSSSDGISYAPNSGLGATVVNDDYPLMYNVSPPEARRYWQLRITTQPFSAAPEIGILTLGRRLEFDVPLNLNTDPYAVSLELEGMRNMNGSPLGLNLVHRSRPLQVQYGGDDPGLTTSGFWWKSGGGISFDGDFRWHVGAYPLKTAVARIADTASTPPMPFWFQPNSYPDPAALQDRRAWLCWVKEWQSPLVDTVARRGWRATLDTWFEVS